MPSNHAGKGAALPAGWRGQPEGDPSPQGLRPPTQGLPEPPHVPLSRGPVLALQEGLAGTGLSPTQAQGPLLPCEPTAWHQCEQGPGTASSGSVPPQHLCECVTWPTALFLCLCFHICVVGSITGHFLALCGFDTWNVGPGGRSGRASSPWSVFCGWLCCTAQHG